MLSLTHLAYRFLIDAYVTCFTFPYLASSHSNLVPLRFLCREKKLKEQEQQEMANEKNQTRSDSSASDTSSPAKTDDVTPEFQCNVERVDVNLTSAESPMDGSDLEGDFERRSTSSDERELANVPPGLREAVK